MSSLISANHKNQTGQAPDRPYWEYRLTSQDLRALDPLLDELVATYNSAEDLEFLGMAGFYAQELPRSIRRFLHNFRINEPLRGLCLISGFPIDDQKIGPTPSHWKWRSDERRTIREQIFFALLSTLLGELFGWATQQDGHMIHDVFPIKENENDQIGTGSKESITWHTEDAFHNYRADWVGLMCLRNHDETGTTASYLDLKLLTAEQIDTLFDDRYIILPDDSHLAKNSGWAAGEQVDPEVIARVFANIRKLREEPKKRPIFFGDRKQPYLCLDPYFMDPIEDDPGASDALEALSRAIDQNISSIVLQPGDVLFIDNLTTVHGRLPFTPRYDGTDRWIKRVNIARDIRKSREARLTVSSRVIL